MLFAFGQKTSSSCSRDYYHSPVYITVKPLNGHPWQEKKGGLEIKLVYYGNGCVRLTKFWINCSFLMLRLLVFDQIEEQNKVCWKQGNLITGEVMRFYLLNVNSFYLYKFLQAGGDCFSNMVIISKGLVNMTNIDAKIFSNTDRYDGFTKNAKHCFLLWSIVFLFFQIFRKKTNAVIFHVNLYFFLWLCQFFLKMKSPPAKFESFGVSIPGNFLVTLLKKCLC